MDWQKVQYQTFQIMWSTKPNSDSPPPLQIRSFTSDPYRVIKEREQKRCQQKKADSKQWKTILHSDTLNESASLDTVVDTLGRGAELEDNISMSDSGGSQLVAQEDCRVQPDSGSQQNLYRHRAQRTGSFEVHREGMTRCFDVSTLSATSPMAPGFTFSELITDTELVCDFAQDADLKQSIASVHELDMIVLDDVDTSVGEPGSGLLHQTGLASQTPSYSTPIHSCVDGCNSERCEQPVQDGDRVLRPYKVVSREGFFGELLGLEE